MPLKIHQELKKTFAALTITEDETFVHFRVEQKKVEKEWEILQKAKEQLETISSFYLNTLSCRALATNYAFYLLERFLLLKIKAAKVGKPMEIKNTSNFVKFFREQNEKVQRCWERDPPRVVLGLKKNSETWLVFIYQGFIYSVFFSWGVHWTGVCYLISSFSDSFFMYLHFKGFFYRRNWFPLFFHGINA